MLEKEFVKKVFGLAIFTFVSHIVLLAGDTQTEWWNRNWKYRVPVEINNEKNENKLRNFQICLLLDTEELIYSEKMKKSVEDIRFIDTKGKELPCWIEKGIDTDATRIWVNVFMVLPKSKELIYLYYGNSEAKISSNFDMTMTKDFQTDESLIALYHLDEGRADEVKDSSGNENHGQLSGDPEWTKEDGGRWGDRTDIKFLKGSALRFNGIPGQTVQIAYSPIFDLTDEVTIEGWINPSGIHRGHPAIFGRKDYGALFPYGILIDYEDKLRISVASLDAITGGSPEGVFHFSSLYKFNDSDIGKWFHVAATYSAERGEGALYINGIENVKWPIDPERFPSETWKIKLRESPLQIGGGYEPFAGIIDELRLYGRVLSADEIKAHYERREYISPEPVVKVYTEKEEVLK